MSAQPSRSRPRRPPAAPQPMPRHVVRHWVCMALVAALSVLVGASHPIPLTGPEPIVIRRGGTYTGTFRSLKSEVPCITIATREPVTLKGCVLSGAGNLIEAKHGWANLTVVNCRGYGLLPSQDETRRGYFLSTLGATSVRVEHNYFEQTAGINIHQWNGDGSPAQTLTIRYNEGKNIDSRYRNGGNTLTNFIALNEVRVLSNLEIAWNQVINEPNNSLVEDNIALYNSGGTAQSPFRIHDNYVQGAYPYPAHSPTFSGTGMIVDGDKGSTQGHIEAYNNQFVQTCNSGMNIAAGHHVRYHHNRIVMSALLPDGTRLPSAYTGIAVFNGYQQAAFGPHQVDNNTIGYVQWGRNSPFPDRQDEGDYGIRIITGTTHLPHPITRATEANEFTIWQRKLRQQGVQVGPSGRSAARAITAATPLR